MRRAFRRGPRSPRRKLSWYSAKMWANDANFENGDSAIVWLRFPAGGFDPRFVDAPGDPVPTDWTLVRTVIPNFHWTINQNGTGPFVDQIVFLDAGIIAWEATDTYADSIDRTVGDNNALGVPDAQNGSYDWIWRWSGQGAILASSQFLFSSPLSDRQQESKAQRKLSAGTGLLFVAQIRDHELSAPSDFSCNLGIDVRFLFKLP